MASNRRLSYLTFLPFGEVFSESIVLSTHSTLKADIGKIFLIVFVRYYQRTTVSYEGLHSITSFAGDNMQINCMALPPFGEMEFAPPFL